MASKVEVNDARILNLFDLVLRNNPEFVPCAIGNHEVFTEPYKRVKEVRDAINENEGIPYKEKSLVCSLLEVGNRLRRLSAMISPGKANLKSTPNEDYDSMVTFEMKTAAALAECDMETVCWQGQAPTSFLKADISISLKTRTIKGLLPSLESDRDKILPVFDPNVQYTTTLFHAMFKFSNVFDFSLRGTPEITEFESKEKVSTLNIHAKLMSKPYTRFYQHGHMQWVPSWSLIHINKTCSQSLKMDPKSFNKITLIAYYLRVGGSGWGVYISHCRLLAERFESEITKDTSEKFFGFMIYVFKVLTITEYAIPKLLVSIYYDEDGKGDGTKLFDFCIDYTNKYYIDKQIQMTRDISAIEILDPSHYLNLPNSYAEHDIKMIAGSDLTATLPHNIISGEVNTHTESDTLKKLIGIVKSPGSKARFVSKIQLASLPVMFYLPYHAADQKQTISQFTGISDASDLRQLNTEFILNSIIGSEEYYISGIVCKIDAEHFSYMRDFGDSWVIHSSSNIDLYPDSAEERFNFVRMKIDFYGASEKNLFYIKQMIKHIKYDTVGIWCIRKSVFDMYCKEIGIPLYSSIVPVDINR
jgi:hypothetical protein